MHEELRSLSLLAVLSALGINEEWKCRKSGDEWYGRCPLHGAKKNGTSFSFNQDGRFHCFSCEKKGRGAIDLVIAVKGCNFQQAVEFLKGFNYQSWAASQPKPEIRQLQVVENPTFHGSYEKFYIGSEWLDRRGFEAKTLQRYGVGQYDNPSRQSAYKGKILLPVRRWKDGELVGYLARNPNPAEGEPKYIWPKGFQKHLELFGAWQIRQDGNLPLRTCYLVESPFTVMAFWQKGFPAVSPFGWSLSPEQCAILAQLAKGFYYLPDRNKFSEVAPFVKLLSETAWVKTPPLPEGVDDPERLSAEQIRNL